MNNGVIQLLVLAAVAVFLIVKLKNVLGTRDGFEKPAVRRDEAVSAVGARRPTADLSVVEGGLDQDITDHLPKGSPAADAVARMKAVEPSFSLGEFLGGAKGAYEMILMAFERGNLESVRPFLSDDVYESFSSAVDARREQGLKVTADFHGMSEMAVQDASFDTSRNEAEITVRFTGEISTTVHDAQGNVVDGGDGQIRRQRDVWTFARVMGADDPNWQLVATDG